MALRGGTGRAGASGPCPWPAPRGHRPPRPTTWRTVAALACRRFFNFETVVPCHYKTFGLLDQTPDKFVEGMEGSGTKVVVPELGKAVEL